MTCIAILMKTWYYEYRILLHIRYTKYIYIVCILCVHMNLKREEKC